METHPLRTPASSEGENSQSSSALFRLPGELRDRIYDLTLSAFEDASRQYDTRTYWARPRYSAPRKSDLALLRTCKKAYREAWFKPWSLADHSFWLTSAYRAPNNAVDLPSFKQALSQVHASQGDIQIDHIRFFAQMYVLEERPHSRLQRFLDLDYFFPVHITITIRHTDWWHWEDDNLLFIRPNVATDTVFPASVRSIAMELESLERKKDQIDSIAKQMQESWSFNRSDGTFLSAQKTTVNVERWSGTSTWGGERWLRDEVEPGRIDYYVATVVWTHDSSISATQQPPPQPLELHPAISPPRISMHHASMATYLLEQAGVSDEMKATDVIKTVNDFLQREAGLRLTEESSSSHFDDAEEDDDEDDYYDDYDQGLV